MAPKAIPFAKNEALHSPLEVSVVCPNKFGSAQKRPPPEATVRELDEVGATKRDKDRAVLEQESTPNQNGFKGNEFTDVDIEAANAPAVGEQTPVVAVRRPTDCLH